jgi:hypothetical protein
MPGQIPSGYLAQCKFSGIRSPDMEERIQTAARGAAGAGTLTRGGCGVRSELAI